MAAPVFRLPSPVDASPEVPVAKGLYSPQQAADWLGVSRAKVDEWCRSGRLRVVRPPDRERLPRIAYEELLRFRSEWAES